MSRISDLRDLHNVFLEKHCKSNNIDLTSIQKLLEAEKVKKLLKRKAMMQETIEKEIEKIIENENR